MRGGGGVGEGGDEEENRDVQHGWSCRLRVGWAAVGERDRLRIRGIIRWDLLSPALWDEKQRDLLALPCNFSFFF